MVRKSACIRLHVRHGRSITPGHPLGQWASNLSNKRMCSCAWLWPSMRGVARSGIPRAHAGARHDAPVPVQRNLRSRPEDTIQQGLYIQSHAMVKASSIKPHVMMS